MWIKSQDGEVLVNTECFFINNYNKSIHVNYEGIEYKMGEYSTVEIAKLVLEDIDGHLTDYNYLNENYHMYKMPEK